MAAAAVKSYADLLKTLLALGKNLPAAWAIIIVIFQKVQELLVLLRPDESAGDLQLFQLSDEEVQLEAELSQAMVAEGSQALFDGSLLRQLWAFAKANPELLSWLLTLLKGG